MPVLRNIDRIYTDDEDEEHTLTVSYYYHPEKKGNDFDGTLPEAASVEVVTVMTLDGKPPESVIPNYDPDIAEDVYAMQILAEEQE